MGLLTRAAVVVAVLALAPPVVVRAQEKTPPSWDTLVKCAEKGDPNEELACYRAAMKAAGYAPTAEEQTQRRRKFGLSLPSLGGAKHESKTARAAAAPQAGAPAEDNDAKVTVEIETMALIPPANKMMLVTRDGAIWQQLDTESVTPLPKPGQTFEIERNKFGGYFCKFDKFTKVRCLRTH